MDDSTQTDQASLHLLLSGAIHLLARQGRAATTYAIVETITAASGVEIDLRVAWEALMDEQRKLYIVAQRAENTLNMEWQLN